MKHLVIKPAPGNSGGFVEAEIEADAGWSEHRRAEETAWACAQEQRDRDAVHAAIRAKLAILDARSVRPLRAILDAQTAGLTPDPSDVAFLNTLRAEADALRTSLVI